MDFCSGGVYYYDHQFYGLYVDFDTGGDKLKVFDIVLGIAGLIVSLVMTIHINGIYSLFDVFWMLLALFLGLFGTLLAIDRILDL